MICPSCETQMKQYDAVGGGIASDSRYETWEIKICPTCQRTVLEFYSAVVFEGDTLKEFLNGMNPVYPTLVFQKKEKEIKI